jgi:hypothetical protein
MSMKRKTATVQATTSRLSLPGFHAEASLGRPTRAYRTPGAEYFVAASPSAVQPVLLDEGEVMDSMDGMEQEGDLDDQEEVTAEDEGEDADEDMSEELDGDEDEDEGQ